MFRFGAYRRPQVTLDFTFDCGDYGVRIQLYKKVCNVQMGPLQVFRKIQRDYLAKVRKRWFIRTAPGTTTRRRKDSHSPVLGGYFDIQISGRRRWGCLMPSKRDVRKGKLLGR